MNSRALSADRRVGERRLHPLTNMPNRLSLVDSITEAVKIMPGKFALLECDVRGLKSVNDTEGHLEGDKLLIFAGAVLMDILQDDDRFVAGHKSGDEFSVILHGVTSNEQVELIKRRIIADLDDLGVEMSIGGRVHIPGETVKDLMKAADALMILDKQESSLRSLTPEQIAGYRWMGNIATMHNLSFRDADNVLVALEHQNPTNLK